MKKLTFLFVFCAACSSVPVAREPAQLSVEQRFSNLPPGGRKSIHGMVLFGDGPHFAEHIPMLREPHDFQIIAEIVLKDKNGKILGGDFSSGKFTIKPLIEFSLNDYLAGRPLRPGGSPHSFPAQVVSGSFEQPDHKPIESLRNIVVEVRQIRFARQLPSDSSEAALVVADKTNTYLSNVITPGRNIQQIWNKNKNVELWCVKGPDFFNPCDTARAR